MKNKNLSKAKQNKNDEFYTRYEDIETELKHYPIEYFKDKVIYCPCDVGVEGLDVPKSNFIKYFEDNREKLGYKKLLHTSLQEGYDYRSEYCQKLFKEADVVVTNPPFSLFRDFVGCLEKHDLNYCIVGNQNAITYKEIFPLIRDSKLWLGAGFKGNVGFFSSPYDDTAKASTHMEGQIRVSGAAWFTNMDFDKRHDELLLVKKYDPAIYLSYNNYDGVNVDKTKDIPCDFVGVMGVPITFLYQYNPDQFEIIGLGIANLGLDCGVRPYLPEHKEYRKKVQGKGAVDGDLYMLDEEGHPVVPYARILIRRKKANV